MSQNKKLLTARTIITISSFLLTVLSLTCMVYLIWWDHLGVYTGYHNRYDLLTDRLAAAAFVGSFLVGLTAIILSFKHRSYLLALLPVLVLTGYFLRITHGLKLASLKGCDMSICCNLDLYADGTYFFRSSSQLENITHSGGFYLSGDTLLLSPATSINRPSAKEKSRIKENKCLFLRPVGFRIQYLEKTCN